MKGLFKKKERWLTYWIAPHLRDRQCYACRAKTRREVVELVKNSGCPEDFGEPVKVCVPYHTNFDLVTNLKSEGGESMWFVEK